MQTVPVNPKPFLNNLTGKSVIVKLKWGMEYKGNFVFVYSFQILNAKLYSSNWPFHKYIDENLLYFPRVSYFC